MKKNLYIPLNRAAIKISGGDRKKFLQGIITNDIEKVSSQKSIYSCLLTPQGKFLFDFFISQIEEYYLIECPLEEGKKLIKRLSIYKLRSNVTIEDVSDIYEVCSLIGDSVFEEIKDAKNFCKGVVYIDPRNKNMYARSIIEKENSYNSFEAQGFSLGKFAEYEKLRITLGIAEGIKDLEYEKSFPLQYRMDEINAIDFSKGCYVGQEVTARSKHRGVVRKTIFTVSGNNLLPEAGTPIMIKGKEVGVMRSSIENIGLALINKENLQENKDFLEARDNRLELL